MSDSFDIKVVQHLLKMKIAFIHPNLGIGGAERLILDIALAMKQQHHEIVFLTNHFNEEHAFQELKKKQHKIRVIGSWIPDNIYGSLHALFAYVKIIYLAILYMTLIYWLEKPDVFVTDQIPVANIILKIFKQKVIYYCHHPDLLSSKPTGVCKKLYRAPINYIEEFSLNLSDIVLVNSKYTAEIVRKTFSKLTKGLIVLYPTVSKKFLEYIKQQNCDLCELYPQIVLNNRHYMFLSINRYHPDKNIELAIYAIDILQKNIKDNTNVHLVIAGGYDLNSEINVLYYRKLLKIIKDNDIENVMFVRSPSDKLKADLYNLCNCVLYTPINEHFGIVPLEAMAAAKPVICCNSGGPCETILHNRTGFLADPNPESFAEYMEVLLDKDMASCYGSNGKEELYQKFAENIFDNKIEKIFTSILAE